MNEAPEQVEIVDKDDNVLYVVSKDEAHQKSLRHRVVNVWYFNDKGEILFQKRSKYKKEAPLCYEESVGGHVTAGETYEDAVMKEAYEETSLTLDPSKLIYIAHHVPTDADEAEGHIHARKVYAYPFNGEATDVSGDPQEVEGFAWIPFREVIGVPSHPSYKISSYIFRPLYQSFIEMVKRVSENS